MSSDMWTEHIRQDVAALSLVRFLPAWRLFVAGTSRDSRSDILIPDSERTSGPNAAGPAAPVASVQRKHVSVNGSGQIPVANSEFDSILALDLCRLSRPCSPRGERENRMTFIIKVYRLPVQLKGVFF